MKTPTEEQLRVYKGLLDMLLKFLWFLAMGVAFFIILNFMITTEGWENKAVFGALDSVLVYTIVPITKNLFPAIKEAIKEE